MEWKMKPLDIEDIELGENKINEIENFYLKD